ncbi:hypothetical protein ACOSQ3_029048 [Xanthoceras sorbifolium]
MLREHRVKTYLCLLEYIRRIVMKRFQDQKEQCTTWNSEIPPTVNAKIIKASRKSRLLKMLSAGNDKYELLGETRAYVVKLNFRSCECGVWQISGVPCSYALVGIYHCHTSHSTTTKDPIEQAKRTRGSSVLCIKCRLLGHNKKNMQGVKTLNGTCKRNKQANTAKRLLLKGNFVFFTIFLIFVLLTNKISSSKRTLKELIQSIVVHLYYTSSAKYKKKTKLNRAK